MFGRKKKKIAPPASDISKEVRDIIVANFTGLPTAEMARLNGASILYERTKKDIDKLSKEIKERIEDTIDRGKTEKVCKDMIADMEKYKYGLAENGTVHSASAHDYDIKYKLQSPEEFEQNGGGICYDYVEFMEGYLNAYGYDCRKYFISTNTADNDTHTFLLVRDGKGWEDGFIYPESSFKLLEGVYEVKNYEEAALKIMDKIFDVNHNGEKYDEIKYYVWEYSGHPPYGSDMKTCMEYFSKGGPIHEGTAKKLADTLNDKIEKKSEQLSVDEFDETHKQITALYDKLAEAYKEAEANADDN